MGRNVEVSVFGDVASPIHNSRHVHDCEDHAEPHVSTHYASLPQVSGVRDALAIGQRVFESVDIFVRKPSHHREIDP
jgi:hypothetical protein